MNCNVIDLKVVIVTIFSPLRRLFVFSAFQLFFWRPEEREKIENCIGCKNSRQISQNQQLATSRHQQQSLGQNPFKDRRTWLLFPINLP